MGYSNMPSTTTIAGTTDAVVLARQELLLTKKSRRFRRLGSLLWQVFLFAIASASMIAVLFIFAFVLKDAPEGGSDPRLIIDD